MIIVSLGKIVLNSALLNAPERTCGPPIPKSHDHAEYEVIDQTWWLPAK